MSLDIDKDGDVGLDHVVVVRELPDVKIRFWRLVFTSRRVKER